MVLFLLYLCLSSFFRLANFNLQLSIFLFEKLLIIIQCLIKLHNQVDVTFLFVESFLHLRHLFSRFLLILIELLLHLALHLCEFIAHLFSYQFIFFIFLEKLAFEVCYHGRLLLFLFTPSGQVFIVARLLPSNLLIFDLNFCVLYLQLDLFTFQGP